MTLSLKNLKAKKMQAKNKKKKKKDMTLSLKYLENSQGSVSRVCLKADAETELGAEKSYQKEELWVIKRGGGRGLGRENFQDFAQIWQNLGQHARALQSKHCL